MKWRLTYRKKQLWINQFEDSWVPNPNWRFYKHSFSHEDLEMLQWMIEELTCVPKGLGFHKIMEIQKHLGDAVWTKLGER